MISTVSSTNAAAIATAAAPRPGDEAAAKQQETARKPEPSAPVQEVSVVVTLSAEAANQATAAPVADDLSEATTAAPSPAAMKAQEDVVYVPSKYKPALAFDPADTDMNGKVSRYEQQSYEFWNPPPAKVKAEEAPEPSRNISADLRAYEEVARAGRSA